ncbi:hypothetical protein FAGKG844_540012 [Frankia sp. AgKG'84/4]
MPGGGGFDSGRPRRVSSAGSAAAFLAESARRGNDAVSDRPLRRRHENAGRSAAGCPPPSPGPTARCRSPGSPRRVGGMAVTGRRGSRECSSRHIRVVLAGPVGNLRKSRFPLPSNMMSAARHREAMTGGEIKAGHYARAGVRGVSSGTRWWSGSATAGAADADPAPPTGPRHSRHGGSPGAASVATSLFPPRPRRVPDPTLSS